MSELRDAILARDLDYVREHLPLDPTLIGETDEHGATLDMLAAKHAGIEMVRYLVEYGLRVNLNSVDARGRDMLHYAAEGGDEAVCRYLVERGGMDPLRGDLSLVTPLDLAHDKGHAGAQAYFESVCGCALKDMYRNPIRHGMFPDPSIVRVGEDYYMVNSTFVFFPCIPVSHSRDLVHWEVIGHAITNPEWANLEGLEGGRGYWAPDISYCNGRFYICATLRLNDVGSVRRRQMVVTSDRPEGPYSEPVFFEEDGIDPSLFHEGQVHLASLFLPNVECAGKDHGGIGVGVDGQNPLVDRFGFGETSGCIHMPPEECPHLLIAVCLHGFWVPLHTQ